MSGPTGCAAACCRWTRPDVGAGATYCPNCDVLVGLCGLHVVAVELGQVRGGLVVSVESAPTVMGCPACGVVAGSHGRRSVMLIDTPCLGRPVMVRWRKRTWICPD